MSNWEGVLTTIHSNVLENLSRFKFLTTSQMMKIGVGTTQPSYLRRNLRHLRDRKKPYIGCHIFNFPDPKKGRVEHLYYLKPRGKQMCIEALFLEEEMIKMPIGRPMAFKDYFHRVRTIDFHIALYLWAKQSGWEIQMFDAYFDKVGNNRVNANLRTKNRILLTDGDYLIPDANILIEHTDGRKELLLYEMHNNKDTGKMIKQIYNHCQAQYLGSPQVMYSLEQPYQVILIFEFESIKHAVIDRVAAEHPRLAQMREYFLCKSLDELYTKPFFEGWQTLSGREVDLIG